MGSMNVFAGGAWRKVKGAHMFDGGAWRKAKAVWIHTGGVWRKMGFSAEIQIMAGSIYTQNSNFTQYGLVVPRPSNNFPGTGSVIYQNNQVPELGDITEMYLLEYPTGRSFNINTVSVPGLRWFNCEFVSSTGATASAVVRANYSTQVPDAVANLFKASVGGTITMTYEVVPQP